MKCLIIGVGQIGRCLVHAMNKLGWDVFTIDTRIVSNLDTLNHYVVDFDQRNLTPNKFTACFNKVIKEVRPNVIISALPYYLNPTIARFAIENRVVYVDLGGSVESANAIELLAKNARVPVMTDLGLAPGWINILAEQGIKKVDNVKSVDMFVGGITKQNLTDINPLSYKLTWSLSGLLNEYKAKAVVLEDGEIKYVDSLRGYRQQFIDGKEYEAFYTSGGSAHSVYSLQKRGIKNCHYFTLRHPGHLNTMKWLLESEIGTLALEKLIKTGIPDNTSDQVVMGCEVLGSKDLDYKWYQRCIYSTHKFTAMQRATAYPCASIVNIIGRSQFLPKNGMFLSYEDIPYDNFSQTLSSLLA